MDKKQIGNLTELQCLTAFVSLGYNVSIPYGDNAKYDFIADIQGQLIRVQVKTASEKTEGSIKFSCRSTHVNCQGVKNERYTDKDIDYFSTYWNNQCYLIPVNECSTDKTLRFIPPKNGQTVGISFASEYELQKQLTKIMEEVVEH